MKQHKTSFIFSLMGLSLATSPFIIGILLLRALGEWLQSMGKLSEELFRAEQLPLLSLSATRLFSESQDEIDT